MIDRPSAPNKCDFCEEPGTVTFQVPDFPMGLGMRSVDGWLSCENCAVLVRARKKQELLRRAIFLYKASKEPDVSRIDVLRTFTNLHDRFWAAYESSLAPKSPPWVEAVHQHHIALKRLDELSSKKFIDKYSRIRSVGKGPYDADQILRAVDDERAMLRVAETYSFSGDALTAILEAAPDIPKDSPLRTDQIPGNGQGFWWFTPPLCIKGSAKDDHISGLLWGVRNPNVMGVARVFPAGSSAMLVDKAIRGEDFYVSFTAYVPMPVEHLDRIVLTPGPALMFRRYFGESVIDMAERTAKEYKNMYGPGGKYEGDPQVYGMDATLDAAISIALIFLASIVWIDQEIVEVAVGHIERHERKRMMKEHKLTDPPTLKVIQLRKRIREHRKEAEEHTTVTGRTWKLDHRFVVRPHWKNQAYGPGRADRKLIYIMPFVKGPEGTEFRTRERVFSVVR